ncbi:MAG: hypothetical protein MUF54_13690 [Polyangiaceae bacterium]|nr:hypothetical protein [Polyangiaceae bacterium]
MKPVRPSRIAQLSLAALALALFPGAKNGCGSQEANETLRSPVQAVTTLLERSDGTVEAELVLISTAANPHVFVQSAREATLRVPDGTLVPLTMTSPGHYTAKSTSNAALRYDPGATYQFRFELDDKAAAEQVSGGSFVAVMDAPDDVVSSALARPPKFSGDTAQLTWSPASRFAIVSIRHEDSGATTYSTFDFDEPQFDGSKWARLPRGGSKELSVDVFPEAGAYTIGLCAVDKVSDFDTSISAELGWLSGFLIGRCAPDITVEVP